MGDDRMVNAMDRKSDKRKERIVELQRQVAVAKNALSKISHGCCDPEAVASTALDFMWPKDKKQPLQHLVGHERRADR